MTKIRALKDGTGYSECSSPDELVGKGRCNHILGNNCECGDMTIAKISRGLYEVDLGKNSKIQIKSSKEEIIEFFNSLPKINEEKIKKIIDFLNSEY